MATFHKSQLSTAESAVTSATLDGQTSPGTTISLTQGSEVRVRQASELQRQLAHDVNLAFAATPFGANIADPIALSLSEFNARKQGLEQIRDVLLEAQKAHVELLHTLGHSVKILFDCLHPAEVCDHGAMSLAPECLDKLEMLGVEIPKQVTPLGMYNSLREFVPLQAQAIAARNQEILALETLLASMKYHIQIGLFLAEEAVAVMTQPNGLEGAPMSAVQVNLRQHLMRIVINPIGTAWPVLVHSLG